MLNSFKIRKLPSWKTLDCYYIKTTKYYCSAIKNSSVTSLSSSDIYKKDDIPASLPPSSIVANHHKKYEKMDVTNLMWHPSPNLNKENLLNYSKKLSKFRLTSLVVITTMAGYAMAPAPFMLSTFAMCSLGTGLVSAAANAINQYHEVPFDSQMSRTKNRVLVTGKVTPLHAIGFALFSATSGISLLYFGVNELSAILSAANLFLYTSVYTPMKRMTILNTWVGSIVGALPPLIGWSGCCGNLDMGSLILAGMLYAWQFPHFNALSWNLRPDYSRAGYRMMAVTDPDLCRRTTLRYTFAIVALSCLSSVLEVTNMWFSLVTLPLNGYFCFLAYKFYKKSDSSSSRKLFRFSLIHLPLLMSLFLLCKTHWFFMDSAEETSDNDTKETRTLKNSLQQQSRIKINSDGIINLSNINIKSSSDSQRNSLLPTLMPSTKAN